MLEGARPDGHSRHDQALGGKLGVEESPRRFIFIYPCKERLRSHPCELLPNDRGRLAHQKELVTEPAWKAAVALTALQTCTQHIDEGADAYKERP